MSTTTQIGGISTNLFAGSSRCENIKSVNIDAVFGAIGNQKDVELATPIYLDRGDIVKFVVDTVGADDSVITGTFQGTNSNNSSKTYLVPWVWMRVWRNNRWIGYKAAPAALIYGRPNKAYQRMASYEPLLKIGDTELQTVKELLKALKKDVCLQVADVFDEWNLEEIPEPSRKHPAARYQFVEVKSPKDDKE